MEYKERTYRNRHFASERRCSFTVSYKKSDLWIGVDCDSFRNDMEQYCVPQLKELWNAMETYLSTDAAYARSLVPYHPTASAPDIFKRMSAVADITGIGPMSAVAGACSEYVATKLKERYGCREIIVENGGDIYAEFAHDTDVAVFAGSSPLSERVGFSIPATLSPIGICTSSGTIGPSLSFGKADAMMIVCRDVLLADSYATAFANKIKIAEDIEPVMHEIEQLPAIIGAIAIKDDKMGIIGKLQMRLFSPKQS